MSDASYGTLADPIVAHAGEDVSHWFDNSTSSSSSSSSMADLSIKYFIDPDTGLKKPYTPEGMFVHTPAIAPTSAQAIEELGLPWWKDPKCVAGLLTRRVRRLRITNTLTSHSHIVEMGSECTVEEMQTRYLEFNAHCGSYVWKALVNGDFRPLDVHKTLEENGVIDDADVLEKLGLDEESPELLTDILIAFKDDLTVG